MMAPQTVAGTGDDNMGCLRRAKREPLSPGSLSPHSEKEEDMRAQTPLVLPYGSPVSRVSFLQARAQRGNLNP